MKKGFFLLLLIGCLMSCTKSGNREFSSQETELHIPESKILGPVMFLPESKSGINFFLGRSVSSDDRVIVALTRLEYPCQSFGNEDAERRCLASGTALQSSGEANEIVKTYTSETKSTWVYGYAGSSDMDSLASCRGISGQPSGAGRCFTEGRYKDLAYYAIFYDPRPGGVLKVRADVEEQIRRWDVKAR